MIPRPTHQWLKPLLDALDGVNRFPLGAPTSTHGFYGVTGIARIATGTLAAPAGSVTGASGVLWYNGGSGAYYTGNDIVAQLKNMGILPR